MTAGVVLIDPKFPHNVGQSLRACSIFGAKSLFWTGERVPPEDKWPEGSRLPREERMKAYANVIFEHVPGKVMPFVAESAIEHHGAVPVAVEFKDTAESLVDFVHPENALYVFGPEDGTLGVSTLSWCHRFVRVPTQECMNLSAAVNVVLYDRIAKEIRHRPPLPVEKLLDEEDYAVMGMDRE